MLHGTTIYTDIFRCEIYLIDKLILEDYRCQYSSLPDYVWSKRLSLPSNDKNKSLVTGSVRLIPQNFSNNLRNVPYNLQWCACLHPSLSCFSTAFLLLVLLFLLLVLMMNWYSSCDSFSKTVWIAPVFNNTLTFPTPRDSASLPESSHLQSACCTDMDELYSISLPLVFFLFYLICPLLS